MQTPRGLARSEDENLIRICRDTGASIGLKWTIEARLSDFLLRLQEEDFDVILFDGGGLAEDEAKWIHYVRKVRPRIPLIAVSDTETADTSARILEYGVLYHYTRPLHHELFTQVLVSLMQWVQKKQSERHVS